jgi:hypothetical protein
VDIFGLLASDVRPCVRWIEMGLGPHVISKGGEFGGGSLTEGYRDRTEQLPPASNAQPRAATGARRRHAGSSSRPPFSDSRTVGERGRRGESALVVLVSGGAAERGRPRAPWPRAESCGDSPVQRRGGEIGAGRRRRKVGRSSRPE